jgi:hypothetical protein
MYRHSEQREFWPSIFNIFKASYFGRNLYETLLSPALPPLF